jgi:putative tricarboxylic transport membrane protein
LIELSTIITFVSGIMAGMLVGLFPAMPIALGMMLMFPFVEFMSVFDIFLYWAAVIIGSQYFGSVAAITTGVPGETSSLIYLNSIKPLGIKDRIKLIKYTARGSVVASVAASVACVAVFVLGSYDFMFWFNKIWVKAVIFGFALLFFVLLSKNRPVALVLVMFGILLGPKNNYALPEAWYHLQETFQNTTFFSMALGLLIVPELFKKYDSEIWQSRNAESVIGDMPWTSAVKGGVIGSMIGLIPGPSATLSSNLAFHTEKDLSKKVTSAESANNSAMITSMLPLLIVGIPITVGEVIVLQILQTKLIDWPDLANLEEVGRMLLTIQLACVLLAVIYYFLSTSLLDVYARALLFLQSRFRFILLLLIAGLGLIDFYYSELGALKYVCLFLFFSAIGYALDKKNIDPIPMLFAFILGDKVIWTALQVISTI